jgi:hypothetical protein
MSGSLSLLLAALLKVGAALIVVNEVRGLIMTAPVFYGIYQAGGSLMAIWLGFCSLAGIALSVIVPLFAAARLKKMTAARAA